jgi:hypothetical protein
VPFTRRVLCNCGADPFQSCRVSLLWPKEQRACVMYIDRVTRRFASQSLKRFARNKYPLAWWIAPPPADPTFFKWRKLWTPHNGSFKIITRAPAFRCANNRFMCVIARAPAALLLQTAIFSYNHRLYNMHAGPISPPARPSVRSVGRDLAFYPPR